MMPCHCSCFTRRAPCSCCAEQSGLNLLGFALGSTSLGAPCCAYTSFGLSDTVCCAGSSQPRLLLLISCGVAMPKPPHTPTSPAWASRPPHCSSQCPPALPTPWFQGGSCPLVPPCSSCDTTPFSFHCCQGHQAEGSAGQGC